MRREQRLERIVRGARGRACHRASKSVALSGDCLNIRTAAGPSPSRRRNPEIACSRLLSVTARPLPRRRDQPILRDDRARVGEKMQQDADVPIGNRHHLAAARDAAGGGIDNEVVEGVRRHRSIIRGTEMGFRRGRWALGSWTLGVLLFCGDTVHAADKTTAGELITEPPTLLSLGFEWRIDGDDNRNAQVAVSYRKAGEQTWKAGPPLLRIGNERINENALQYMTPNGFAGSIFDLEPGTELRSALRACRIPTASSGKTERIVTVRTRVEPMPAAGGKVYHVYPPGYKGERQEPAFTGLLAAYYTGSSHSDNFNTYPPRVQPGDTILVHAGVYKDDRYRYGGGLGTVSSGTYFLTQSGTAEKPIVIKAAGDGEAIFDGDGAYNLFNVMAANYNYFEGLTIRNTELAFQAGLKNITGSSGLTIKRCRFENVGRAIYTDWSGSKDYYIADNVMIGRFNPELPDGIHRAHLDEPARVQPEARLRVRGEGLRLRARRGLQLHRQLPRRRRCRDLRQSRRQPRSRSATGCRCRSTSTATTSRNVEDNCIEADGGAHNIRIFRNRCFNHGHRALSVQPMFGGPVYFIRNVVYHAPEGGAVKFTASSSGIVVYHNTLIAPVKPMLLAASNVHYRNNLILGKSETLETFAVETNTNYSSSDYNGFRPNEGAEFSFEWSTPPLLDARQLSRASRASCRRRSRASSRRPRASSDDSRR